ncbi:hypothetical protein SAMN06298216_1732 [Spirosomataceae bacterium TFI 002]|nr:hypothetical protein SAMN06298216_1732 [Spirosomataceae bacterium TFI 002]
METQEFLTFNDWVDTTPQRSFPSRNTQNYTDSREREKGSNIWLYLLLSALIVIFWPVIELVLRKTWTEIRNVLNNDEVNSALPTTTSSHPTLPDHSS